jgi:sugar (glycoside-pentoside-hexuronide) transporter
MKELNETRNRFAFSLGTIGRDMLYTLVGTFLTFYLTDVLDLPKTTLWWAVGIILVIGVYDAFNDPFMGILVDNTRGRFGKFMPWIAGGAVLSALFTVLFYSDFGIRGAGFLIIFTITYLLWEVSFTANDIAYWSMLPSLSLDQKVREKIAATARICANIGMFAVIVSTPRFTRAIGYALDNKQLNANFIFSHFKESMNEDTILTTANYQKGFFYIAIVIALLMVLGQCITVFGVREPKKFFKHEENTTLRGMFRAIFKNDQLLFTAISMALFMIGYCTTTSFGLYFFKYAYRDEGMYTTFALVLGVSQIGALVLFPYASKLFPRKKLYLFATILVVLGYIVFFLAPMDMLFIGLAGVLIFIGQAFIQLLMLVFLSDTIEYGQWKLGKRNEAVSFSIQPFINKVGAAVARGIVGATIIISGISDAKTPSDVTPRGLLIMKSVMLILPLLIIVAGYLVYHFKYKIDKQMYDMIVSDLKERGDIGSKNE